jgi:hypothetical protein
VKEYDATTFWEADYLDHDFQMHRGINFVAFAHSIRWMITDLAGIRYDAPFGQRVRLRSAQPLVFELGGGEWTVALSPENPQ